MALFARVRDADPRLRTWSVNALLVAALLLAHLVSWPHVARELSAAHPATYEPQNWLWPALASGLLAPVVLARRRLPLTTLVVFAAGGAAAELAGIYTWTVVALGMVVASHSIGRYLALARSLLSLVAALAVEATRALIQTGLGGWVPSALFLTLLVGAWWAGRLGRLRSFHLAELRAHSERLELARDAHTRAILAEERSRIARELHDVVAHHVSVMTVQATAGRRVIQRDPEQAGETLLEIETTGRQALAEMRRLVGVLRSAEPPSTSEPPDQVLPQEADTAPQPGLDDLEGLVRQVRDAGLHARLHVDHSEDAHGHRRQLPAGLELTLYRLTQESLTNVLKHSGAGTHVSVTLRFSHATVALEINDDGSGSGATNTEVVDSPGHGLLGMAERVALFDGELTAHPHPDGGFLVQARVPLPAAVRHTGE
ncbi:sensor histidine kinase [Lipingzhangella rawalii]|nr:sensor histidine kinase [Lipingzhangella rawalii]